MDDLVDRMEKMGQTSSDPSSVEPLLISLRTTADLTRNTDDAFSQVLYHLNAVLNTRARGETPDSEMYESAVDELLECIKLNEPRMCEDAKNIALLNFAKSFSAFDHNLVNPLSSNSVNVSEQDSILDNDNEMEEMEQNQYQTSFTDMHDIAIMQVMKKLEIPSLLAMRLVNKRMDTLHYQFKFLQKIELKIFRRDYLLGVTPSNGVCQTTNSSDFNEFISKLDQLDCETPVHDIEVKMNSSQHIPRILTALSNFDVGELNWNHHGGGLAGPNGHRMTLPIPLSFASNIRRVKINIGWVLFAVQDLCAIRKAMLEGRCKMEYLRIAAVDICSFLDECFGVTMERDGEGEDTEIWNFRTVDESVELYLKLTRDDPYGCGRFSHSVNHFERKLKTRIDNGYIILEKCKIDEKDDVSYEKIEWNHAYAVIV